MSTSVTLAVPGSAGQTKTPTDCCASIFRAAPICPCIARPSSARSQGSSMKGRERPCSIRPQLRSSQNVLRRSVEPAAQSCHSSKGSRLIGAQQPISLSFATLKKHLGRHAEQDLPDRLEMGAASLDLLRERVHVAEAALERA